MPSSHKFLPIIYGKYSHLYLRSFKCFWAEFHKLRNVSFKQNVSCTQVIWWNMLMIYISTNLKKMQSTTYATDIKCTNNFKMVDKFTT